MRIRGFLTICFILSQTAVISREYISSGIIHSNAFWNNGFGFDLGMLDLILIFLCFAVAWVNNERCKLNEAHRHRFNLMRTKYLHEEQTMAKLEAWMEGFRGRYTNVETPLRKVKRNLVTVKNDLEMNVEKLENLCREFEELKVSYVNQSQSYPNQAHVLKALEKRSLESEIRCLKEYIEREVAGLQAEMDLTLQCTSG